MIQIYYSDATGNDLTPENKFYILYVLSSKLHTLHTKFVRQSRSTQVDCWVNSRIWFDCTPAMGDAAQLLQRRSQKYGECVTKLDTKPKVYCPSLDLAMAFVPQCGSNRTCFHQQQKWFSVVASKLGLYCFLWALLSHEMPLNRTHSKFFFHH